jgi:hypothetical protein
MLCPTCNRGGELARTRRVGLLERHVYPLFGYFPWICALCKVRIFLKCRGERRPEPNNPDSDAIPDIQADKKGPHRNR